jgi:predicted O-methyltransferase YrrM
VTTRFLDDLPAEGGAYLPSQFSGDFLGDRHRTIDDLVSDVPGKLRHADELKLYELAFMARGPILEIGTDRGRSLAILAIAARDAGRGHPIWSVDISDRAQEEARRNLDRLGLAEFVTLIHGDSAGVISKSDLTFDMVFVDGDHTFAGVTRDLLSLQGKVAKGGSIVFHDYYDPRNDDPAEHSYGVAQAVEALRDESRLRFRGGCGAVGIYEQL